MSITSLSLTFVNMYAPQGAKPAAVAERPAPTAHTESRCCDEARPAPRQNRLVEAMMSALRELGLGNPAAAASAPVVAGRPAGPAATGQPAPAEAVTTNASSVAEPVAGAAAVADSTPVAAPARPAAEPAVTLESAVHQFAHELFRALRQIARGEGSEERSGRVEGEGGNKRHHGHHDHHGHHGWRREGYGDMAQRLEALSQTFAVQMPAAPAAPVADAHAGVPVSWSTSITLTVQDGPAEAPATAVPVQNSAKNPLLDAFSKLFNALKPQSPAMPDADMGDKLRLFLHSLAQAIRPEAMNSIQTPQVGGLVNVSA